MPFNGVMNPQELAILTAALDAFCEQAAIQPDTYEFEEASHLIMSLYRHGATIAEILSAAIENRLLREVERH